MMDTQSRENVITWRTEQISKPYNHVLRSEYPELEGLPADDGGESIADELTDLSDEKLEELNLMDTECFATWVRQQFEDCILHGWFLELVTNNLDGYVSDRIPEDAQVSEEDVKRAMAYLAQRLDAAELVKRLDDDPKEWIKLVALVKKEEESERVNPDV